MNIVNLNSEPNNKNVTVCLSYKNIRDIANGLYEVSKINSKYKHISEIMYDVFTLTKEGFLKAWSCEDGDIDG